jgi:hypothetical protein
MTIDLVIDLDTPTEDAGPERRQRQLHRLVAAAIAGVVLLSLGGPEERPYRPWYPAPVSIAARETTISLTSDALYSNSESVTGYRLTDGRRMWTVDGPHLSQRYAAGAGDIVLIGDPESISAIDRRTGARRWTAPGLLIYVSAAAGRAVTMLQVVRPDGTMTAPGTITVLDLATGAKLWSVERQNVGNGLVVGEGDGGGRTVLGVVTLYQMAP